MVREDLVHVRIELPELLCIEAFPGEILQVVRMPLHQVFISGLQLHWLGDEYNRIRKIIRCRLRPVVAYVEISVGTGREYPLRHLLQIG